MSNEKYIGLDVHQATISVAVVDFQGKVVMESILETKASTPLERFPKFRLVAVALIFASRGSHWMPLASSHFCGKDQAGCGQAQVCHFGSVIPLGRAASA